MKWLPASVVLRRATVKKYSVVKKCSVARKAARPVPPHDIDTPPVRPVRVAENPALVGPCATISHQRP